MSRAKKETTPYLRVPENFLLQIETRNTKHIIWTSRSFQCWNTAGSDTLI